MSDLDGQTMKDVARNFSRDVTIILLSKFSKILKFDYKRNSGTKRKERYVTIACIKRQHENLFLHFILHFFIIHILFDILRRKLTHLKPCTEVQHFSLRSCCDHIICLLFDYPVKNDKDEDVYIRRQ